MESEHVKVRMRSGLSDRLALLITKVLRFSADLFFRKRYGHRAVVLETIAAVPGMVGGLCQHLRSLRNMSDDNGWIKILLDEAANERMHLMTFVEIAKPTRAERYLILIMQFLFFVHYLLIYLVSPKLAHRIVGYFEEEAVRSYTEYLRLIEDGYIENVAAPKLAIDYWNLDGEAKLSDVITVIRKDEENHRDVNHSIADKIKISSGKEPNLKTSV